MRRPRISSLNSWGTLETLVLEVLILALKILSNEHKLPQGENKLNRKFFYCIRRANHRLLSNNRGIRSLPFYEAKNQPDVDDETRAKREDKVPDFQWSLHDAQESNPEKSFKYYVVECKRLGLPSSSSWKFNENYVLNGVCRFVIAEWGYGKSSPSGAMIAYVQSMDMSEILDEVNRAGKANNLSEIRLSEEGWRNNGVSKLNHQLNRPEVPPTPFNLTHLWLDLRKHFDKTT